MLKRLLAIFLIFQLSLAPAAAAYGLPSPPSTPSKAMQEACQTDFEACHVHLLRADNAFATLATLYGTSDPEIWGKYTDEERELFGELYHFQADKLVTAHSHYEQAVNNKKFSQEARTHEAFKLLYDENILNMINSVGILSHNHPLRGLLRPKPQKTGGTDRPLSDFFSGGSKPKASDLKSFAEYQGWKPTQTANGPLTYVDSNGVKRLTIKQGSGRTPGSDKPHVEVRDATGQRIDPRTGDPVTKRSPGNHVEIDFDL